MNNKFENIFMKNYTCYFFNDIINIKKFHSKKIKIDEKSQKIILIYYTEYVKIKDTKYLKIKNVNPLYLIINKVNG